MDATAPDGGDLGGAGAASAGPFVRERAAQRNQPVYPAYDGFLKNADGSYHAGLRLLQPQRRGGHHPAGAGQLVRPGPVDRQQPHVPHRPLAVSVRHGASGPEFDGKLRWTLTYAGTTTGRASTCCSRTGIWSKAPPSSPRSISPRCPRGSA